MQKDAPRQAKRMARKAKGLPASDDVGIIADLLGTLRNAAEKYLGHKVNSVLAATPNLVALYREDIEDAFEYLSIKSLDNPNYLYPLFREPAGAEANYGLGLCQKPFDADDCHDELIKLPFVSVLTVLYTHNALCVEVSDMKSSYAYYACSTIPSSMDFTLGSNALHDNPNEDYYWAAVRERIITALVGCMPGSKPTIVFLMGDCVQSWMFNLVLEDTLGNVLGYVPKAYQDDHVFAAARGAAEFARGGGYWWNSSEAPGIGY
jgi:hypothetical protein